MLDLQADTQRTKCQECFVCCKSYKPEELAALLCPPEGARCHRGQILLSDILHGTYIQAHIGPPQKDCAFSRGLCVPPILFRTSPASYKGQWPR